MISKEPFVSFIHSTPPRYLAYMLRMWEARSERLGRPSVWRFSLENPHTKQRYAFPDLQALFAFLQAEMDGGNEADP